LNYSPRFADNLVDQIFSKEKLIARFPNVDRVVPELNNSSVRELIYKQFRIIYVVLDNETIHIITVHPSSAPLSDISLFG